MRHDKAWPGPLVCMFIYILFSVGADLVTKVEIANKTQDTVTVIWDQPKDPNGVIFTYTVEYQRIVANVCIYGNDCFVYIDNFCSFTGKD